MLKSWGRRSKEDNITSGLDYCRWYQSHSSVSLINVDQILTEFRQISVRRDKRQCWSPIKGVYVITYLHIEVSHRQNAGEMLGI